YPLRCSAIGCTLSPAQNQNRTIMSQLDQVLSKIDADLDASLDRLFQWLKVPSISTDPAYKDHCRAAGQWLVDELNGIGVEASLRETGGHPVVLGHAGGDAKLHV